MKRILVGIWMLFSYIINVSAIEKYEEVKEAMGMKVNINENNINFLALSVFLILIFGCIMLYKKINTKKKENS